METLLLVRRAFNRLRDYMADLNLKAKVPGARFSASVLNGLLGNL